MQKPPSSKPAPKYTPQGPLGKVIVMPKHHHYIRTFFASIFGTIALSLILASILVVWLNRTLTDTNTYVKTVAPLVAKPAIQNYVADKLSDTLLKNAPPQDVAATLLTPDQIAGKTPDQLQATVKDTVKSSVLQVITAPKFQDQWEATNRSAHIELIDQINAGSKNLSLDLSPLLNTVVTEVKATKLAPVAGKLDLPQDAGKLNLKGGALDKAHDYYKLFQTGTLALIGVTILAIALCVGLSVHHMRTLRRILIGTGVEALILVFLTHAPSLVKLQGLKPADQQLAVAIAAVLFHDLQLALIIIAAVCIVLAILSKVWSKLHE